LSIAICFGEEIRRARSQGYAWINGELDDSICGLAVPIRNADGATVAAVNISLPTGIYTEASACEQFLLPLRQTASKIRGAIT
jgi:IclR family pca regulon transcriptional regulator